MAKENSNDRSGAPQTDAGDAAFADETLSALPRVAASATLEARILADFASVAARRRYAPWAVLVRLAQNLRDAVWPGAPVWKPASVFALSLLFGLAAGALVPASDFAGDDSNQMLALDTTPDLDLLGDL